MRTVEGGLLSLTVESVINALRRDRALNRQTIEAHTPHMHQLIAIVDWHGLMDQPVRAEDCFGVTADYLEHLITVDPSQNVDGIVTNVIVDLRQMADNRVEYFDNATDEEILHGQHLSVESCDLLNEGKLTFKILLTTEPGTLLPRCK